MIGVPLALVKRNDFMDTQQNTGPMDLMDTQQSVDPNRHALVRQPVGVHY